MDMEEDDYYYRNADARDHRTNGGARPMNAGNYTPPAPVRSYVPPAPTAPMLGPYGFAPPVPGPYGFAPPVPGPYGFAPPMPGPFGFAPPMSGPYGFAPPVPGPYGFAPPMPGPFGFAPGYPGYPGYPGTFNGRAVARTVGRVIRAATPVVVALLGLPTAPTPVTATGDTATDLKGSLTNEANQIVYQTALAQAAKRDETVYAIGHGVGLLLEKGIS
jgi:hypothetical protein